MLALVAALVLTVRIEEWRLAAQRRRAAAVMVAESNRSAERDTTRDVAVESARVARLLGDSLRLVEKQVVQVSSKRDAIDRALGRERVARLRRRRLWIRSSVLSRRRIPSCETRRVVRCARRGSM